MELQTSGDKLSPCSIGCADNSTCHLTSYSTKQQLKLIQTFELQEQLLISRRSGLTFDETSEICLHHEALLLVKFEFLQKLCCNPFKKKNHIVKKSLRAIDSSTADQLQDLMRSNVKPGEKLCPSCRKEYIESKSTAASASSASDYDEGLEVSEKLNASLTAIGVSPLKFQRISRRDSCDYAMRKISQVQHAVANKNKIQDGHTVAGTRENHQFVPIDEKHICVSRVSNDTSFFTAHVDHSAIDAPDLPVVNLQPGQYVACIYDNNWWIGNICETSVEEHDALINFMHPHGIAHSFHWPERKNACWIPEQHIIAILPAPTAMSMG